MLTIYRASAGSGKTHQLTGRYIEMLLCLPVQEAAGGMRLNHPDFGPVVKNRHRNILAITFTNMATEEMKQRIVDELDTLRNNPGASAYFHDFQKMGCTAGQVSQTAGRAMKELLDDFVHFNVSTIDSFFQQVMRSMAYELDYPGDYEVTLDTRAVVAEGVGMMFDEFNSSADPGRLDSPVANQLRQLMLRKRESGTSFNVFNRNGALHADIIRSVAAMFDEKYQMHAAEFEAWLSTPGNFEIFCKTLTDKIIESENAATSCARQLLAEYNLAGIDFDAVTNGRSAAKLIKPCAAGHIPDAAALAKKTFVELVLGLRDETALFKTACFDKVPESLRALTLDALLGIYGHASDAAVSGFMLRETSHMPLMQLVIKHIARFRRDNNIIVLSDTAAMLRRMMQGDGQVPFIYEKMGIRLSHFLIDEFQDTSRMQWENLRPLIDNGLAQGANSLIIGDVKQAIYRFRNSDYRLLHTVVPDTYPDANIMGNVPRENCNWRSAHDIVRFNNTLFSRWSTDLGIDTYDDVVQTMAPKNKDKTAYICIRAIDGTAPDELDPVLSPIERHVITEILRQHDAGYAWRDIAVLSNVGSSGKNMALALMINGIPVVTPDMLMLKNSPAVNVIVAMLRLVRDNGIQGVKLTDGTTRPDIDYMTAAFDSIASAEDLDGNDPVHTTQTILRAFDLSDRDKRVHDSVAKVVSMRASTLTGLVEQIVRHRLTPVERDSQMTFIAAFQDLVLNFSNTRGNCIDSFLKYWKEQSDKLYVASPDNVDAVNVLTVHKSKGLQFACVHYIDAHVPLRGAVNKPEPHWAYFEPGKRPRHFPPMMRLAVPKTMLFEGSPFKNMAERQEKDRVTDGFNRFYVALTRAERELHVWFDADHKTGSPYGGMMAVLEESRADDGPDDGLFLDTGLYVHPGGFTYGTPTHPDVKTVQKDKSDAEKDNKTQNGLQGIRLEHYGTGSDNIGTRITGVQALVADQSDDIDDEAPAVTAGAADRGTRIHNVLSRIIVADDVEKAVLRALKRGEISGEEFYAVKSLFAADAPCAPYMAQWFDPRATAATEVSVLCDGATTRIDRLVTATDGTIDIIDYKSDADPGDTPAPRYVEQLRGYAGAVRRARPGRTVRAWLLYTATRTVSRVD